MNITYLDPLSKGWERMKKILFRPFDLNKWFMLGFSAFLADLLGGSFSYSNTLREKIDLHNYDITDGMRKAWEWLADNPLWFGLIASGSLLVIALLVLFNWLSSRGKFMFLDNVVHDTALIEAPWKEFRKEGNSLFLWRLVFGIIIFAGLLLLGILFFTTFSFGISEDFGLELLFPVLWLILLFLLWIVVVGYISLFLNDFVVPIMYRYRISTTAAWRRFLPLLKEHFWYFFLYGLFIFFIGIAVTIALIIAALMTCCIGLLLLVIPYINSVALLPVTVTFRSLSLYFLEQFGPDYRLFTEEAADAAVPGEIRE